MCVSGYCFFLLVFTGLRMHMSGLDPNKTCSTTKTIWFEETELNWDLTATKIVKTTKNPEIPARITVQKSKCSSQTNIQIDFRRTSMFGLWFGWDYRRIFPTIFWLSRSYFRKFQSSTNCKHFSVNEFHLSIQIDLANFNAMDIWGTIGRTNTQNTQQNAFVGKTL